MKKTGKRGRECYSVIWNVLRLLSSFYRLLPMRIRLRLLSAHRNTGGNYGLGLRYALLASIAKQCGNNVVVFQGVYLLNSQNLTIGSNVSIQPMCYLECGNKGDGIIIGSDVSIGHGATLMATSHNFSDLAIPIRDQGVVCEGVTISDNVWIGAKAVVLSGVHVSKGCILGAGTVVTKDTDANGIYVGVPARRKRERGSK